MYAVRHVADPLSPFMRDAFSSSRSFIPLRSLREGFLEDLFRYVVAQTVVEGHVIFEPGAIDNQCIYLHSGAIALEFDSGHREVYTAGESVLPVGNEQPRPCKAIALEDCTLLRVDSDHLDRALSWSQAADYLLSELALDREHDGQLEWFDHILASNLFFKVPPVNAQQILSRLTPMVISEGEAVIEEGEIGDCCYFLKEGAAKVFKKNDSGEQELLAEILPGRCFGEDALVERCTRNASIIMSTDGLLMRLEKDDFDRLLIDPEVEEVNLEYIEQLAEPPVFLDVRTDDEYRSGHLAFSASMPLCILAMKKRLLSLEVPYVVYCETGRRARAAAYFLGKQGYNVLALQGGLKEQNLLDRLVIEEGYMLRNGRLVQPAETG